MARVDAALRIEIFVADLARTVTFCERLGFELTGRSDGPPRYAALRLGHARVGAAGAEAIDPALRAVPVGTEIAPLDPRSGGGRRQGQGGLSTDQCALVDPPSPCSAMVVPNELGIVNPQGWSTTVVPAGRPLGATRCTRACP